jgi:hypothetical protein
LSKLSRQDLKPVRSFISWFFFSLIKISWWRKYTY